MTPLPICPTVEGSGLLPSKMVNVPLGGTAKLPRLLLRAITLKVKGPMGTGYCDPPPMTVGAGVTVTESVPELVE